MVLFSMYTTFWNSLYIFLYQYSVSVCNCSLSTDHCPSRPWTTAAPPTSLLCLSISSCSMEGDTLGHFRSSVLALSFPASWPLQSPQCWGSTRSWNTLRSVQHSSVTTKTWHAIDVVFLLNSKCSNVSATMKKITYILAETSIKSSYFP